VVDLDAKSLGFTNSTFSEVIIVTLNKDGSPNPAPMGVKLREDRLVMWIYQDTQTFRNITEMRECTVNLTCDAKIFFNSIFRKKSIYYKRSKVVRPPRINGAYGWVEAKVLSISEDDPAEVVLEVVDAELEDRLPRPFNRAEPAVIEALVQYTKIRPFLSMGLVDKAVKSYLAIRHCREAVFNSTKDPELRDFIDRLEAEGRRLILEFS